MFLYGWKLIPWSSHVYISSAGISCLVMTLDFAKALVKFKYTEQLPVVYAFMTLWVPGISVVFFLDRYKVVHGEKVRKLVYFPNKKRHIYQVYPILDLVLSSNSLFCHTSTIISRCVSWYKPNWYWSYVNQLRWGGRWWSGLEMLGIGGVHSNYGLVNFWKIGGFRFAMGVPPVIIHL